MRYKIKSTTKSMKISTYSIRWLSWKSCRSSQDSIRLLFRRSFDSAARKSWRRWSQVTRWKRFWSDNSERISISWNSSRNAWIISLQVPWKDLSSNFAWIKRFSISLRIIATIIIIRIQLRMWRVPRLITSKLLSHSVVKSERKS